MKLLTMSSLNAYHQVFFLYVNIIYRIYYFIDMNDDAADLGDITIVPLKPLHVPESSSMYFKLETP